jgi:hypothetical protein
MALLRALVGERIGTLRDRVPFIVPLGSVAFADASGGWNRLTYDGSTVDAWFSEDIRAMPIPINR